jgi:ectoine hydroxylase-related dioxygenase (phytanoyl-CoA dioxygenase family)
MTTASLRPSAAKEAYDRDGYVLWRGFFPAAQIARAAAEAEELLQRYQHLMNMRNMRCRWQPNTQTGECQFETFDPIIDLSLPSRELALDARLLEALAGLYDEPACLFKDKLIYKPPGLKGYDLHQDWIGWPGFPRSFLTVLVPYDAADRDNGATEVFTGYHHSTLSPEDGEYHALAPELVDPARGVLLEMQPGDIAVFGGFTPHRSAPNQSQRWRRQLYLSYNKLSDGGEQRTKHYEEFHVWLRKKYAAYGKTDLYFE